MTALLRDIHEDPGLLLIVPATVALLPFLLAVALVGIADAAVRGRWRPC